MEANEVDISSFSKSSTFYGQIKALITIKSFDLQAIRQRYIKSRSNKGGKTGSFERREPSLGGIASIKIEDGHLAQDEILIKTKEPRAIHIARDKFAFAAENVVFVIDKNGEIQKLENPWFSYVHTVQFHPSNSEKLLISSSGFDLILEYNLVSNQKEYEWIAWEHGFNSTINPETGNTLVLTRNLDFDRTTLKEDQELMIIHDPRTDSLPTAKRAAFINSVTYDSSNPKRFLATFFHHGAVYSIDSKTGAAKKVLTGLKNPHGGHRLGNGFAGTSTGTGEIHIQHNESSKTIYSLRNLQGKPIELTDLEWVQNTASFDENFVAIDSNRTSFVIFNPELEVYDIVPFNADWAVQDIALGTINSHQRSALKAIN